MECDHAFAFSIGRDIVRLLVLMSHPRYVMVSAKPPSACSFLTEAVCGLLIGSSLPLCGRNCRCSAMRTAICARRTLS